MDTLSDAPLFVQLHVIAALLGVALAPLQLFRRRRDRLHKILGYTWVMALAFTALSSFAIHDLRLIGPFSPIHLLSVWVLYSLWVAIRAARSGDIARHSATLRQTAFWGLGVAGAFTLIPGRLMGEVLFGRFALEGFVLVLGLMGLVFVRARMWRRV